DMCTHSLIGKIKLHIRAALAALTVIRKADRLCVRDEISRHEKTTRNFAFAAEVAFGGRVEAVEERIVTVKNKINVVEQVHYETAIRHGEITRRLAATRIEMLVVRVDGNSEQTSWSPFEGLLLAIVLPHRSGAIAFGHVDHLFIEDVFAVWFGPAEESRKHNRHSRRRYRREPRTSRARPSNPMEPALPYSHPRRKNL